VSLRAPDPVTKTVLVVANETLGGRELIEAVRERAADDVRFVLCVPQNKPSAGLVIYDDAVFDAAQVRVDLALEVIRGMGIRAIGEVGDPDPYSATTDAVGEYRPQEIVISTYPETRSGWLRRDLIDQPRDRRAAVPLTAHGQGAHERGLPQAPRAQPRRGGPTCPAHRTACLIEPSVVSVRPPARKMSQRCRLMGDADGDRGCCRAGRRDHRLVYGGGKRNP
jgi:hypothetical protein